MRILSALVVATLAAGPYGARSEDQAPQKARAAPTSSASSREGAGTRAPAAAHDLARALLTSEQWSKVLDSYASSLAGQISQALLSKGEKVPDDLRGKLRDELGKTLPYQDTIEAQATALAKELSPDELRKTATFYASPVGRKVLDKLPEAQSAVAQQLQARLATAVPEIVNRLAPSAMAGPKPGGPPGGGSGTGSTGGGAGPAPGGAPEGAGPMEHQRPSGGSSGTAQ
jgi:hypothetical protein